MKIGILTLRLFKNYGGILQNYALSRFLQKNGYDVETINIVWSYQLNGVKKYFVWLKRLVRNMLIGKWYSLDEEKILRNNELVAAQRVNAFKEKNIPLSQKVYSLPGADFSDISNKYDTIIVGSDQVWRPKYTGGIEKYRDSDILSESPDHITRCFPELLWVGSPTFPGAVLPQCLILPSEIPRVYESIASRLFPYILI